MRSFFPSFSFTGSRSVRDGETGSKTHNQHLLALDNGRSALCERVGLSAREAHTKCLVARIQAVPCGHHDDPSILNFRHQEDFSAFASRPPLSGMLSATLLFSIFQVGGMGQ